MSERPVMSRDAEAPGSRQAMGAGRVKWYVVVHTAPTRAPLGTRPGRSFTMNVEAADAEEAARTAWDRHRGAANPPDLLDRIDVTPSFEVRTFALATVWEERVTDKETP